MDGREVLAEALAEDEEGEEVEDLEGKGGCTLAGYMLARWQHGAGEFLFIPHP